MQYIILFKNNIINFYSSFWLFWLKEKERKKMKAKIPLLYTKIINASNTFILDYTNKMHALRNDNASLIENLTGWNLFTFIYLNATCTDHQESKAVKYL